MMFLTPGASRSKAPLPVGNAARGYRRSQSCSRRLLDTLAASACAGALASRDPIQEPCPAPTSDTSCLISAYGKFFQRNLSSNTALTEH